MMLHMWPEARLSVTNGRHVGKSVKKWPREPQEPKIHDKASLVMSGQTHLTVSIRESLLDLSDELCEEIGKVSAQNFK